MKQQCAAIVSCLYEPDLFISTDIYTTVFIVSGLLFVIWLVVVYNLSTPYRYSLVEYSSIKMSFKLLLCFSALEFFKTVCAIKSTFYLLTYLLH